MADREEWLQRVFESSDLSELSRNYEGWAGEYDADMQALGYRNPAVVAALTARYVRPDSGLIIDVGAGTGLLGEILAVAGYNELAALDISEPMLDIARAKGVYKEVSRGVLGEPLDFGDQSFAAVVCTGVFTAGHAQPDSFDELLRVTRPGGHLIFTVGTPAYEQGGFKEKLTALEKAMHWRLVEATSPYRPMPLSPTEGTFTTRAYVYQVAP